MAGYFSPTMGQPQPLPTLQGYLHQRPLPAPYGYGDGGDFRGGNQIKPPPLGQPPQVPPTAQLPQQQPTVPTAAGAYPTPTQGQPNQAQIEGSTFTGNVWTPKPPWYRTDAAAYKQIQFPGVKNQGSGRAWYEDGSMVDYGSPAWGKAQSFQPPAAYSDLWAALPDSWKVDLAGRDPIFWQKWLEAVTIGNNAQAQDIYKQSTDYRTQQQQAKEQGAQRGETEYRDSAYAVPSR